MFEHSTRGPDESGLWYPVVILHDETRLRRFEHPKPEGSEQAAANRAHIMSAILRGAVINELRTGEYNETT